MLLKHAQNFLRYHAYVRSYSRAVALLYSMRMKPRYRPFKKFIRGAEQHADRKSQTLHQLLGLPMQRLGKYPALIQRLLATTPPTHEDHQLLLSALQRYAGQMTQVLAANAQASNVQAPKPPSRRQEMKRNNEIAFCLELASHPVAESI